MQQGYSSLTQLAEELHRATVEAILAMPLTPPETTKETTMSRPVTPSDILKIFNQEIEDITRAAHLVFDDPERVAEAIARVTRARDDFVRSWMGGAPALRPSEPGVYTSHCPGCSCGAPSDGVSGEL